MKIRFISYTLLMVSFFLLAVALSSADTRAVEPPSSGSAYITPITRNSTASQTTLVMAQNGQATLPIVVSKQASDATKAVAAELAVYLKRMTGAAFETKTGDGSTGIVLGTLNDFPTPALN